ncbi:MAG TPA: class I SAM-dependent methyltransferase [Solirubrobacteraceae bacterium]|nr:class I SAM-dependent methyltransferase [Solirubrobacteraceae bacterium]
MPSSAAAHPKGTEPARVRNRFRAKAQDFDDLYEDERPLARWLRPGLFRRRQLAADTVAAYDSPRVLDVGCGSGRIGEFALQAGAGHYVGIDFSEPMIALARSRLERFGDERVELAVEDFLDAPLDGPFEVVLAVGLFDYLPAPHEFTRRMFELCAPGGCVVGSFPSWSLVKGPIRKLRYEWIGDCPIFNYSRRELQLLFGASGFQPVEILSPGRSGHLVRAYRPGE